MEFRDAHDPGKGRGFSVGFSPSQWNMFQAGFLTNPSSKKFQPWQGESFWSSLTK
jgi:hypothetical protein